MNRHSHPLYSGEDHEKERASRPHAAVARHFAYRRLIPFPFGLSTHCSSGKHLFLLLSLTVNGPEFIFGCIGSACLPCAYVVSQFFRVTPGCYHSTSQYQMSHWSNSDAWSVCMYRQLNSTWITMRPWQSVVHGSNELRHRLESDGLKVLREEKSGKENGNNGGAAREKLGVPSVRE